MKGKQKWKTWSFRFSGILVVLLMHFSAMGQTWDEWFRQRRTQRRYLLMQIGELKIYADLLQKGYTIAKDGWHLIRDITNGEFNLHNRFFTSLKNVNPAVLEYAGVGEILVMQTSIYKRYRKAWNEARSSKLFSEGELELFYQTFSGLIEDVVRTVDELIRITTANKLEMTDDQRIRRIELLRRQVIEQFASLQTIEGDIIGMAKSRTVEYGQLEMTRRLYGE